MGAAKGTRPWNAGTSKGWINGRGYREIRVDGVIVKEHRHIASQHLGRPLSVDEDVHHINGDKTDNRIENLEVISHGAHTLLTNQRPYKRGYRLTITEQDRQRRAERMRQIQPLGVAAIAKVEGRS